MDDDGSEWSLVVFSGRMERNIGASRLRFLKSGAHPSFAEVCMGGFFEVAVMLP